MSRKTYSMDNARHRTPGSSRTRCDHTQHASATMSLPGACVAALLLLLTATVACGQVVTVQDITTIDGRYAQRLWGTGIVVGLNGTGDGGKSAIPLRALASALSKQGYHAVNLDEMKDMKNVALVTVDLLVPPNGARAGEDFDVSISATAAKSLEGGRLLPVPLLGPHPADKTVYALASGPISISDPDTPTVGVIKEGGSMLQTLDHWRQVIDPSNGQMRLRIRDDHATWPLAHAIALAINEAASVTGRSNTRARVESPKTILLSIPQEERANPAGFISWIQQQHVPMPDRPATVTIDDRTQTWIVDGRATISPVVISHKGVTISIDPPEKVDTGQDPSAVQPLISSQQVDVRMLTTALEQLAIPADETIEIIRLLERSGNLHARIINQQ